MLTLVAPEIEDYARAHSQPETDLMARLRQATQSEAELPQMLSGPLVGQTLRTLCRLTAAELAVEVGTFTGYASLWIAGGLRAGGKLITTDINEPSAAIARRHWAQDPLGERIELRMGPALASIEAIDTPIDFAFIDADKAGYIAYYEALVARLRPGGLIVADNVLWSGRVLNPEQDSDHALAAYNRHVAADPRSESLLLPLRDGLMVSQKI